MNMLILIMGIKPMMLIMDIELMVILVPSALPVFCHVLCLMKWRPYLNDIYHSEGSSCACWIIHCHYISSDNSLEDVAKQRAMGLFEILSHDLWQSSPIIDFDLPAKADKSGLLASESSESKYMVIGE